MTEWRNVVLGDVIELKRGYDLPKRDRTDGPFPIVSSSGISGSHSEAKVRGPGVVTGRYGTLGQVFYIADDFWPLNTSLYVRNFKGNSPRFVALLLESMDLEQHDGAAAVPGLNRNQLHTVPVRVPDRLSQDQIASIVESIDEMIENNRRRMEVLEEMARVIYREWFVRFRYPGHEDVPLVESALGPIPEGWDVATLGEAGRWLSGGTPKTSVDEYWNGEIPWITSGTLTSLLLDRSDRMVTQLGLENGTRLVPRDALVFVVRGMSLVREFRVGIADVPVAFGQDCKALLASDEFEPLFLAMEVICRAEEIQGMHELAGHGTGKLSTDRLKALQIPKPPATLQERFVDTLEPIRESMTALRLGFDRLVLIRELLLPKLVTGQIDVSRLDLDGLTGVATG